MEGESLSSRDEFHENKIMARFIIYDNILSVKNSTSSTTINR